MMFLWYIVYAKEKFKAVICPLNTDCYPSKFVTILEDAVTIVNV